MVHPAQTPRSSGSGSDFFIGIDSDGCVFDTMEVKHKKCFCPAFIEHYNLEDIEEYARQTWEFVNLYSRQRGVNRFSGLLRTIDLLSERKEVLSKRHNIPALEAIRQWIGEGGRLCNESLEKRIGPDADPRLAQTLAWSRKVNELVARHVNGIPPFPFARKALDFISQRAHTFVISSAAQESLLREWRENDLEKYVMGIAGQESGSKKEQILHTAGEKYPRDHILIVGDSPGDMEAAALTGVLFFPIVPGQENESWRLLLEDGFARLVEGSYRGDYQESLARVFLAALPVTPPWED